MATPFDQAGQQMGNGQPPMPNQQPGASMQGGVPEAQPSTTGMPQQTQMPGGQGYDPTQSPEDDQMEDMVDFALSDINLAKKFRNKTRKDGTNLLDYMGSQILEGYTIDETSRQKWLDSSKEFLKLALLVREGKTWPWPRAANVKYPLISTAAMQFSARAYPALVPSDGSIVKAKVSAVDQQGLLEQAAIRVAKHMSYQVSYNIPNWEEDMDKLLMAMAVTGICFKKTFYDSLDGTIHSTLVYPENLCINYWAKSLEQAYRKTELLYYTENDIQERVNNDESFLDIDYGSPTTLYPKELPKQLIASTSDQPSRLDGSTPFLFLSCHTFWDLDGDGYEEPYIITVHKNTGKVVRIIARWDSDGVTRSKKNPKKILRIKPVEYFTDFPFIPNPDGSIYALGFGELLGSLTETCNTLINQLVDAGTMATLQAGFIGRNLRLKEGQLQMRPNEWKVVNATGTDLKNSIYPLPTKEPSPVLFQLLGLLIKSANELASIAEIFVGKMPGQNTPATTTQETIQQGMAVFTAIYKRVYRSLAKEFKKIFRINRITPDIIQQESKIVGQIQQSDYDNTEHLIIPGADPSGDSRAMRQQKLQQISSLIQMGTINPMAFTVQMLQNLEFPNYQELLAQPQPPQPDPKAQTEQVKQQTMQMKAQLDQQKGQQDISNKQRDAAIKRQIGMDKVAAQQVMLRTQVASSAMKVMHENQSSALDLANDRTAKNLNLVFDALKNQQDLESGNMQEARENAKAQNQMARNQALHEQQMELQAEAAKANQQSEK